MVSRVGLVAILVAAGIAVSGAAARTPPTGTAMFLAEHDPRLCPSPLCGGYWVVAGQRRADALRGRAAADALLRRARSRPLRQATMPTRFPHGSLVRGAIELGQTFGDRRLDQLRVYAVYAPAGTAAVSGGYYRVVDTGIRLHPRALLLVSRRSGQRIVAGHDLRDRPPGVGRDRQERSSGHRRRYERRTASTHAAGSRRRRTAAACSARCASTSERRSLAPEDIPGEPHVVLGRPEVADASRS